MVSFMLIRKQAFYGVILNSECFLTLNNKGGFFQVWDFHRKDKTVVRQPSGPFEHQGTLYDTHTYWKFLNMHVQIL